MNSAVSTPSRPTARNASAKHGHRTGFQRARHVAAQFAGHAAAALFIQSTIVVTIATATSDAIPAIASAARPEIVFSPNWMTRNTATVISDCRGDAQPYPLEGVAAVGLDQERHQDRHDDRGLQALAQTDQTAAEQLRCDVGCRRPEY